VKKWGMKNGEVFDTDAGGELIVNNSVEDSSDDASDRDFKGFHRVVGLKSIPADVVMVRHKRRWSAAKKNTHPARIGAAVESDERRNHAGQRPDRRGSLRFHFTMRSVGLTATCSSTSRRRFHALSTPVRPKSECSH
jgi:hypothetical protein